MWAGDYIGAMPMSLGHLHGEGPLSWSQDDWETNENLNLGASVFQESGFTHTAGQRLKYVPLVTKLAPGQLYASFLALSFDFR